MLGLQSCVTRKGFDGADIGSNQKISIREALACYTVNAATATGEQDVKGRLAPGYLADFVVLGGDPITVDPDQIASIPIEQTYVGGRRVWSAEGVPAS